MNTDRCQFCPVAADRPCLAILSRHRRICQLLDPAHPLHHPDYAALARQEAPRPDPGRRLLDPDEADRLRAAETCPHRDCTGCGCRGCRCRPEGLRPGELVTIRDCLACVSSRS